MQDRNQFEAIMTDAVRDDVWRLRDYQLTRTGDPAGPSHCGMRLKKIQRVENTAGHGCGVIFRVLFNVLSQLNQMSNSPAGPDDGHRGALVSPGFPQDLSHFATFS